MKKLLTVLIVCLATPLPAQDAAIARTDRQFMKDILTLDPGGQSFEETLPAYLNLFRQNDFDGEPGYSLKDRELYVERWEAKIFSERMQKFLKHDLNGDLTVEVDELRANLIEDAYRHLRIRPSDTAPVPDAVEVYIADKTEAFLRTQDLDGDRAVSFEEAQIKARDIARHARDTTAPVPRMAPSLAHDLNDDTVISEVELIALARRLHATYDTNGDGEIDPEERQNAYRLDSSQLAFMRGVTTTASREIEGPTCPFPRGDEALNYYVIGGYEGSALTNVHFENPNEAVEAVKIHVPKDGNNIRIIAAFQTGTILQIEDPGLRVKVIYDTRGPIAVTGASTARIVRTDPSCHVELWKPISTSNPDPRAFYGQVLNKSPVGVMSGYSIGIVDLEKMENDARRQFPRAIDIDLSGPAADLWAHVLRYNPGGLISINAGFPRYAGTLGNHKVLPQYAGLAELVEKGVLDPLPRDGTLDGVSGSRLSVRIDGTEFRPGGGDDAIHIGGLIYRYERPGAWVGRAPLKLRANESFTYPAGLNGAHAVSFVLPADVREPQGDRGQSVLERESPDNVIKD